MNIQEKDILNILINEPFMNQRALSNLSGHSLGIVNRSINQLIQEKYLDENKKLTQKSKDVFQRCKPKNAIILAAGYGMRMIPINMETPKGLLEIGGEPLIERIIKQLNEVGIKDIYIVVGFMKERYEYLIDEYNVELVVNEEYASKNNLYSMRLVEEKINNSYIIPCDIWSKSNPFRKNELYSWYMVSDSIDDESNVRVNRNMELTTTHSPTGGNRMIGISYILNDDAEILRKNIINLSNEKKNDNEFWEKALYDNIKMIIPARIMCSTEIVEINTYEQLRELDSGSNHLKSDAICIITDVFGVDVEDIKDITVLKKGMTNRSFLFNCQDNKYIMRIPGEGTDMLIDRQQEANVYNMINGKHICDNIVYINPKNGYKITEFMNGVRTCNPNDMKDVLKCMNFLRKFHELGLKVDHDFDIFSKIDLYESLWESKPSVYRDYKKTKENVLELKTYIDLNTHKKVLTHIDAVCDNFLFVKDVDGNEVIRLIDWEYSGMQDPHVDIAMFAIYALYDREQVEQLIDLYFEGECKSQIRAKIYCYISSCGLLWSNWCEYKRNLGVEFGEYSIKQYRYAKEYYRIAKTEISKLGEK